MKKLEVQTKQLAISKANAQMVGIVAAACFVTIFCLFASKAVWTQNRYESKVITVKEKARDQLDKNIKAFNSLQTAYQAFDNNSTNVIGGLRDGGGDDDGSNSKIILDALPTTYDFPALASSIEKILSDRNFSVSDIKGTDDQVNQQANTTSPNPQPVSIPFSFTVDHTNYNSIQDLITALQQSIRPIVIDKIDMGGGADNMTATIDAHTYYQPAKSVSITNEAVK
jgi:hypothetical protein